MGRNLQDCSIFDEEMAADQDFRSPHMSRSFLRATGASYRGVSSYVATRFLEGFMSKVACSKFRLPSFLLSHAIQILLAHAGMLESMKQSLRLSPKLKKLLL